MIERFQQSMMAKESVDRLCDHTYLPRLLGPTSTVLDLGANRGSFSHGMISKYHCRVFAVEPVSDLRVGIAPSTSLTLLPFAVGGRVGRARMNVFGSRCASVLQGKEGEAPTHNEEVEMLDLRGVLGCVRAERVDLMKVDIEGAEVEMFSAASDADLLRCTQITVEFHDFVYPEQRRQVESVKRRLRSLGFWVINFSLDNTDVLFVNKAASGAGRLEYMKLKYITKYMRGIRRRLSGYRRAIR